MKLCRLDSDNIRILLEKEDLVKYNLTAGKLSDKSDETKAAFMRIVNAAGSKTDFDPEDDKILIEAFPKSNGEVLLYVTRLALDTGLAKRGKEYLFCFSSTDDFIGAYCELQKSRLEMMSKKYYKKDGDHYLSFLPVAISRADNAMLDSLLMTLREYGDEIDEKGSVSILNEHAAVKTSI